MSFARYPEYKDSWVEWLGEVPAHWSIARGRTLFEIKKRIVGELGFDVLAVTQRGLRIKDIDGNEGQLSMDYSKYQLVEVGDFAMNHMDLLTGYVDMASCEGVTSPDYRVFAVRDTSTVDPAFMLRALQNGYHMRLFFPFGQGSSHLGRWRLPTDEFKEFSWPVPPRAEQTAIAAFLDRETAKIDALVAEQVRLIELLKEKRQAVISHAVTKGLDPSVPMKDSGVEWLGEVPAHWEVRPIRRASTFVTSGPRGWSDFISEEGTLFVQSGDLDDEQNVLWQSAKRVSLNQADLAETTRTRLLEGDVVVCITGAKTGNVAIVRDVTEPAHINQHLCLIRPTSDVRAAFMGRYLASETGQRFLLLAQYGLKQGLGLDDIKSVSMPVPPVDEQEEIALTIDHWSGQMNQLMSHAQTVIALLQERRAALISAAVTGQIDVRRAPEQAS